MVGVRQGADDRTGVRVTTTEFGAVGVSIRGDAAIRFAIAVVLAVSQQCVGNAATLANFSIGAPKAAGVEGGEGVLISAKRIGRTLIGGDDNSRLGALSPDGSS